MIQANYLRIGNKVNVRQDALHWNGENFKGAIFEIEELKKHVVNFKGFHAGEYYKHLAPIVLTEEILLKCGFIRIENNWKVLDIIFSSLSWERLAGVTLTLEHESIYFPHIRYLHQLQNLYFALTNQELEVKL